MRSLSTNQLSRIEGLGLNCEIGNVLRRLGNETPSLFRWTWASPTAVLDLLRSDFAGLYDVANLVPGHHNEVLDTRYNVWFHTNVPTGDPKGGADFHFLDPDEKKRTRILAAERSVIETLVERFRKRMRTPDVVFILTRHARESLGSTEEIAAEIRVRAEKNPFVLMEVLEAPNAERISQIEPVGDNFLRGYIARFAPQDAAHDVDMESWTPLLENLFAITDARTLRLRLERVMRKAFGDNHSGGVVAPRA